MHRTALPFALLLAAGGGGAPVPATAAGTCMVAPNPLKTVSSRFGIFRTLGQHGSAAKRGHMHDGLDFSTGGKTPLYATADGKVVFKGYWGGYGNSLVIERQNGHTFRYSHMSGFADGLAEGSEVKAGQQLGIAGNTGGGNMAVHLHFSYGVPGQQEVRAKQFYADAGRLKSLSPTQLPTVLRNGGRGLGWKTDPSPYFCEAFPTQDGRGDRFGKTTKAQYALLYGDAPEGGAPPELAAARMQQAEAAANGQSIEEFLTDSDGYGALPGPPIGTSETQSAREWLLTEATRRFASADWANELPKVSSRALWVDYVRANGVSIHLADTIRHKKQRVEALLAVYTSQKLASQRQQAEQARRRAVAQQARHEVQ
ncbi:M23 family metallopeptidase [Xanthomonas citri]|uniref:M23 family metallopeptidase n=1 Tax=Xanthomonas citri TaxID=346 RepID=UPI001F3FC1F6|nr:M23 family metallopeptidase [Xanthomonas citri]